MATPIKHPDRRSLLVLLLLSLSLLTGKSYAQKVLTHRQQQAIEEIAIDRVEVFTKYLALLAKEQDDSKRKAYERYIALSFVDQEQPLRVYNDLLPASVVEHNPILDKHIFLEDYLKQLTTNYGNLLSLSFTDHALKNIGYSQYLKQYYVVVTAQREIKGQYRNGVQLIDNRALSPVDFFVHLEIGSEDVAVGSLFGFEPHQERQNYTRVEVGSPAAHEPTEAEDSYRKALRVESSRRKIRLKRGQSYVLNWTGGLKDDIIEVELIPTGEPSGKPVYFEPLKNEKSARVLIGEDIKTGLYRFKVTNITTGHYTQTGYIKIKRKFLFFGSATDNAATPADAAAFPARGKKPFTSTSITYHS